MQTANVAAGEIGVILQNEAVILRPSFFAMSKLLESYGDLESLYIRCQYKTNHGFSACINIIQACSVGDISHLTGEYSYRDLKGNLKFAYKPGLMSASEITIIGQQLLKTGIIGKPHPRMKKSESKPESFNPAEFAGAAISQFNMNPDCAWNMTMIEFQRAIESKYPQLLHDTSKYPSKEDYNSIMSLIKKDAA